MISFQYILLDSVIRDSKRCISNASNFLVAQPSDFSINKSRMYSLTGFDFIIRNSSNYFAGHSL
jgi:hypothetical protein